MRRDKLKFMDNIFKDSFNKERFAYFIKNLLNHYEEKKFIYKGNTIPKAFQDSVKTLQRIGQYKEGNAEL